MSLTPERAAEIRQRPRITPAEEERMVSMWAAGAPNSEVHAAFPEYHPGTIDNKKVKLRPRIIDRVRQEAVEMTDSPNRRKPARVADAQRQRDQAVWLMGEHIKSAFMVNPETGLKEFVESLIDYRKVRVYWEGLGRANQRIAEELGELMSRLQAQAQPDGKATYEIPGLDINDIVQGWNVPTESTSAFDPVPVEEPEPPPVRRPVPPEHAGKAARDAAASGGLSGKTARFR